MQAERFIKVLVWDLDETLWHGTLLEGDELRLRSGAVETLRILDERGILHSLASKNDTDAVQAALERFGLERYFLYPQIGWSAKSVSIRKIAEALNLGLDSVAFIDDQRFELEEVAHSLPEVVLYRADELEGLVSRPELNPRFLTPESALRRQMYQADLVRDEAEQGFEGPAEEFLASLEMHMSIAPATQEDLQRAEELTVRTNQLNSTGVAYSYDELDVFRRSGRHLLLVARLKDRFGTYGTIGLALVEQSKEIWNLKLLLMSCRVMARGVGSILLGDVMRRACEAGARLQAELVSTGRNRMMIVTYRFAGFKPIGRHGDVEILERGSGPIPPPPVYVYLDCRE